MKIAVPYWRERVSPVFDVASTILLIDAEHGREVSRRVVALAGNNSFTRAKELAELMVEVLICGAISRIQETTLFDAGIRVIPFVCGNVDEIIAAFISNPNNLTDSGSGYQMPGCCGRRRQNRHGCRGKNGITIEPQIKKGRPTND